MSWPHGGAMCLAPGQCSFAETKEQSGNDAGHWDSPTPFVYFQTISKRPLSNLKESLIDPYVTDTEALDYFI